ncbi:MAG: tetratricopeptide repeat protein [Planctomycetota bacterium]
MQVTSISESMNIAVQQYQTGHLNQAEMLCREILLSEPDYPDALHLLGAIAYQRKQYNVAVDFIGKAISGNRRTPQFHNTLGAALRAMGKFKEAIAAFEQAVSLKPDYVEAYNNMGNAYLSQGCYADAVEKYNKVVSLNPDYIEAYNSMAVALQYQGKFTAAIDNCYRALSFKPDYTKAYNTIASVLLKKGLYTEAIENYKEALRLDPDYVEAHINLGMTYLLSGRFEEGWAEYRWRLNAGKVIYPHNYQLPCWDGSSFVGRRLLVHYEQGFGDNIQFVRYLPMVKARGGTVICEMLEPLIGLFRGFPGIDELIETSSNGKTAVEFDFYVPLLELPRIFGTTLETIPAEVPYLHTDSARAEYWQQRLTGINLKVGIVWAGKPAHTEDKNRSCRLRHFLPLAKIPGVRLYGLQKGNAVGQVKDLAGQMSVMNLADELKDFTDTAAVIENLDLVISVDTAVLHLAGAMGKPAWAILPFTPDWRWMLDRQDSPWYPTLRLFRQIRYGDWDDVFQRVAEELKILAGRQKD